MMPEQLTDDTMKAIKKDLEDRDIKLDTWATEALTFIIQTQLKKAYAHGMKDAFIMAFQSKTIG